MIGFIGANDKTIPYKDDGIMQNVINSTNNNQYQNYYRKENFCLDASTGSIITKSPGPGQIIMSLQRCAVLKTCIIF